MKLSFLDWPVRDSEGKPIIVKGQLNHVSKPKPNNVDTFVKHVYVESDNYEYKIEGWINLDNFELEIGRNRFTRTEPSIQNLRKNSMSI